MMWTQLEEEAEVNENTNTKGSETNQSLYREYKNFTYDVFEVEYTCTKKTTWTNEKVNEVSKNCVVQTGRTQKG